MLRRFSSLPSAAVLLAVSGIVLVDAPPPRAANAAPFGKIAVVGEFEDGPFGTPTDLLTSSDQPTKFGLFGYTYGSKKYQYACAQKSGGSEPWNGNGYIQTTKLKFGGLCFVRVDTSVGQIALSPRAFLQSTLKGPFTLDHGQTFICTLDGGSATTKTVNAVAASVTGGTGAFGTIAGGDVATLAFDGGSNVDVIFEAGDTTIGAIVARINQAFGVTVAADDGTGKLKLTSTIKGLSSRIVVANSTVNTTKLGLTAATTNGTSTSNFANVALVTYAELKAFLEASTSVKVSQSSDGFLRVASPTGATGTIAIGNGTANAALGFTNGASATAATSKAITVPAGTRASDGGADASRVVTMQTTAIAKGTVATTLLKVRPAVDDGTYAGLSAGSIDTLEDKPGDLEWSVGNPLDIGDALSPSELDSLYLAAIETTKGPGNDTTKRINGIVSARQSNAIRAALKQNAVDTSKSGHYGRRAFLCPPNGTDAATIIGAVAPGVGAYRAEEVAYAAGGVRCVLQELIDGGYSDTGEIVRHPDMLLASRWSVLTPGYNPGQFPEDPQFRFDASTFPGIESAAAGWDIATYAAFKTAGVCGVEFDKDTGIGFEQGITAVDPATDPSRVDISRKTLADSIGDSLAALAKVQAKRQGTVQRRNAMRASFGGLLDTLLGDTVDRYVITLADPKSQPTHVDRWDISVNPVESSDVIVFNLSVGPNAVELSRG